MRRPPVPGGTSRETEDAMTLADATAVVLAATAAAVLAAWLPDAQALDFLLCLRFTLAQGCLP